MILFAGCSSANKQTAEENKKASGENSQEVTITFHHYFSGSMSGGIDQMVNKMNDELKSYKVKAVPIDHEAFKVRIKDALNGENTADMYSYWAGAKTESLVPVLESLDDMWAQKELDKVFPKAIIDSACSYDGKKYLVPVTQHFVGLVYNKKVFKELGITPPKDWNGFLSVCEALKASGKTPLALGSKSKWPAQFWFDYLLLRTAPAEYRQQLMAGKASYTDGEVQNAFALWKMLIDKGYFNMKPNELEWDTGAAELVYEGKAAMTLMGTWIIGYYGDEAHKWKLGTDYDIFEFPVLDKSIEGCSLGPIDGIVIPAKSWNKEQAKEAVAYFANVETQKLMSTGSGSFAPSMRVEDSFYTESQARLLNEIRANPNWAFNYDLATIPEVSEIGLAAFGDFLEFPAEYKRILQSVQKDAQTQFELKK